MNEAYDRFTEGQALLASANAHAAVVALERARELEPEQGSIREALARAYFRTGRFSDAEDEFTKAVEIDPVNDYAHFGLGLCRLRAGDQDRARGHLKLATIMRPESEDYREALARVAEPDDAGALTRAVEQQGQGGQQDHAQMSDGNDVSSGQPHE